MEYIRYLEVKPLNWEALPDVSARLQRHGIQVTKTSIEITRYPNRVVFDSWDQALTDVRKHGRPAKFSVALSGRYDESRLFRLTLRQYMNDFDNELYLLLSLSDISDEAVIDDVTAFLGVTPDRMGASPVSAPRTAFVAHRFDAVGEQVADRLARFLSLLEFSVKTGRSFSPKSVSEKVKERVQSQAVVFVILTLGTDPTWLTQESILGHGTGKPLFILLERNVEFKPGLLGDLEFIPFTAPHIDTAFVPILEGLHELGYSFSHHTRTDEGDPHP